MRASKEVAADPSGLKGAKGGSRKRQHDEDGDEVSAGAKGGAGKPREEVEVHCNHCGRLGHRMAFCYNLNGFLSSSKGSGKFARREAEKEA